MQSIVFMGMSIDFSLLLINQGWFAYKNMSEVLSFYLSIEDIYLARVSSVIIG